MLLKKISALPRQLNDIWRHPLNRGHRVEALGRWARWQITSRLTSAPIVIPFAGVSLFARAGETGVTGNIYYGLADYEDMAFTLHLLRNGDVFVDVGANSGAYSVLASGVAGARTVAFEPITEIADRFEANVRLNKLQDLVVLHRVGVGSKRGTLRFTTTYDTVNHVAREDEEAVEIVVETLDLVLKDLSPTLIKIDVEGFEVEVLAGAAKTLLDPSLLAIIIEINDSYRAYGHSLDDVVGPIEAAGFASFRYQPENRNLERLNRGCFGSGNVLFVRDISKVRDRLRGDRLSSAP